jgi:hypothetical protein
MAARLYALLGTRMSLGNCVGVVRIFDGFKEGRVWEEVGSMSRAANEDGGAQLPQLRRDLKVRSSPGVSPLIKIPSQTHQDVLACHPQR